MNKVLLIAIATTILATSATADSNTIYLRADAAANMFTKEKVRRQYGKFKTKTSGSFDVGVGYKLMDTVRAELVYTHHLHPEAKATVSDGVRSRTTKNKAKIDTLAIRGYVDFYDLEPAKLFAGAGIGLAQVKEEVRVTNSNGGRTFSRTFRKKNNMTYSLMGGAALGLMDGVFVDLQYIWSDFGKAKGSALKRRSHALSGGVRLEL